MLLYIRRERTQRVFHLYHLAKGWVTSKKVGRMNAGWIMDGRYVAAATERYRFRFINHKKKLLLAVHYYYFHFAQEVE